MFVVHGGWMDGWVDGLMNECMIMGHLCNDTDRRNPKYSEKIRFHGHLDDHKSYETKLIQVTFALKKNTCPTVQLNNKQLTQPDDVKYLGIHLDRKLTWRKHISTKRKQLDLKLRKLCWIDGRNRSYQWKINY